MSTFERAEVEAAFRKYYLTGIAAEDWGAWSRLFTDDATYKDHYWGTFHGPAEIEMFLNGTMKYAPGVYTPLIWYVIDDDRVVYKAINRADHPDAGEAPFGFESLQLLVYAGDGKWRSEEDWWIAHESRIFARDYAEACARVDPEFPQKMSRRDWGSWVDWARPPAGHTAQPSWLNRPDVPVIATLKDIDFGVRNPK